MPTIVIKAMDGAVLMMDGPKSTDPRTFDDGVTLSDMVLITTADYGFNTAGIETVTAERLDCFRSNDGDARCSRRLFGKR